MAEGKEDDGTIVIDRGLRDRTARHIETFSEALDKVLVSPSPDAIDDLRATADDLMRAIARVLLELEGSGKAP
jgi:hypothetical protein